MSKVSALGLLGVATLGMALGGGAVRAQEPPASAPAAGTAADRPGEGAPADLMGLQPVRAEQLADERGGTEVHNDMLSQGVVSENQAINVTTGSNFISDGSFSNAGGVPMVVQNTGNNVLIQNSTILNIQVQ